MSTSNQDTPAVQEIIDALAPESTTPEAVSTVDAPSSDSEAPKKSKRKEKAFKAQQQAVNKMFKRYEESQAKAQKQLNAKVRRLRNELGKEDFEVLKDICTIRTPEQKNDKGEVTQEASSVVNFRALFIEGRFALTLNREARILAGKRKRTTGRGSDRIAHKNLVNYINSRSSETAQTETVKS